MATGPEVTLRPFEARDVEFLHHVYAAARAHEMALLEDWTDAQKDAFLRQQFEFQHIHYQTHYPGARYDVIERDGEAIGRFYVHRGTTEIRIMDIALAPAWQGRGIGGALVREVLAEAAREHKIVTLHVEIGSRARRFYERLGFVAAGAAGFHTLMHWVPSERSIS